MAFSRRRSDSAKSGILLACWLVSCSSIALAAPKIRAPAGARLLDGDDIRRLIVGHSVIGPVVVDNAPTSTTYYADGRFSFYASGGVATRTHGSYRIAQNQLCTDICSYFARTRSDRYFMSNTDRTGRLYWAPVRVR